MIRYEWVIEPVDEWNDILESDHADTFAEALQRRAMWEERIGIVTDQGTIARVEIGLVRDTISNYDEDLLDREWAYLEDGKLWEHFENAAGAKGPKVPKRFLLEVEKGGRK